MGGAKIISHMTIIANCMILKLEMCSKLNAPFFPAIAMSNTVLIGSTIGGILFLLMISTAMIIICLVWCYYHRLKRRKKIL
jgi:hypothetical protein